MHRLPTSLIQLCICIFELSNVNVLASIHLAFFSTRKQQLVFAELQVDQTPDVAI